MTAYFLKHIALHVLSVFLLL